MAYQEIAHNIASSLDSSSLFSRVSSNDSFWVMDSATWLWIPQPISAKTHLFLSLPLRGALFKAMSPHMIAFKTLVLRMKMVASPKIINSSVNFGRSKIHFHCNYHPLNFISPFHGVISASSLLASGPFRHRCSYLVDK